MLLLLITFCNFLAKCI
jgi:hypothetical protein